MAALFWGIANSMANFSQSVEYGMLLRRRKHDWQVAAFSDLSNNEAIKQISWNFWSILLLQNIQAQF